MKKDGDDDSRDLDDKSAAKVVKTEVDVLLKEEYGRLPVPSPKLLCSPEKEGNVLESKGDGGSTAGVLKMGRKSQAQGSKKVMASTSDVEQVELQRKCSSPSTGLFCLSATSTSSIPISLAARQGLKVHFGPSLVIVNTIGGGERLELGLDLERGEVLEEVLEKANEHLGPELTVRATLTSGQDPFAWVSKLPSIPKVGGSGLYQLSVQRPPQPHRGEMSLRKELEEVTRQLEGVARLSHGEGESLVLVGHMVHALAYSNHIARTFNTQLQHVWLKQHKARVDLLYGEKWFIVMLKEERKEGGALHRQLYVHHELNSMGRVVHLEQAAFGASHTFLAMVELSKGLARLTENLVMLEVDEACLPSSAPLRYMVDSLGFYVVDGCFPSQCEAGLKDKFAKEMQAHGAVGFRKGDSEQRFSLQFVNPSGLERAIGSSMATTFSLVIKSQARKVKIKAVSPGDAEQWRLLGPGCEDLCKGGDQENWPKEVGEGVDEAANVERSEVKGRTAKDERGKGGKGRTELKTKDMKEKKPKVKDAPDKTSKADASLEEIENREQHDSTTMRGGSTEKVEKSVFQSTDIRERKKSEEREVLVEELSRSWVTEAERTEAASKGPKFDQKAENDAHRGEEKLSQQVAPMKEEEGHDETQNKREIEPAVKDGQESEQKAVSGDNINNPAILSEDQLLSIRWKKTGNLTTYLNNLVAFLGNFPDLKVEENENVALVFPSQLEVLI